MRAGADDPSGQGVWPGENINVRTLTANGAAMHATTARELLDTLRHVSRNPQSTDAMLINGSFLRRPDAARDIAHAAMRLAGKPPGGATTSSAASISSISTGGANRRTSADVPNGHPRRKTRGTRRQRRFAAYAAGRRAERLHCA